MAVEFAGVLTWATPTSLAARLYMVKLSKAMSASTPALFFFVVKRSFTTLLLYALKLTEKNFQS